MNLGAEGARTEIPVQGLPETAQTHDGPAKVADVNVEFRSHGQRSCLAIHAVEGGNFLAHIWPTHRRIHRIPRIYSPWNL